MPPLLSPLQKVALLLTVSVLLSLTACTGTTLSTRIGPWAWIGTTLSPQDGLSTPYGTMLGRFKPDPSGGYLFHHCLVEERDKESTVRAACGEPLHVYPMPGEEHGVCLAYKNELRGGFPTGEEREYTLVCTAPGEVIGERHAYTDRSQTRRVLYLLFVKSLPGSGAGAVTAAPSEASKPAAPPPVPVEEEQAPEERPSPEGI